MLYQFKYNGGNYPLGQNGDHAKLLLFLVSRGKEIPFFKARKEGIVEHVPAENMIAYDPYAYQTDCAVLKVRVDEYSFGKNRLLYDFYILLSKSSVDRQTIEIKPLCAPARAAGYIFRADGRFLRKAESLQLFDEKSLQARMIQNMQLPPVDALRKVASVTRFEEQEKQRATRHIRVRRKGE